jgi:hypothetical protein
MLPEMIPNAGIPSFWKADNDVADEATFVVMDRRALGCCHPMVFVLDRVRMDRRGVMNRVADLSDMLIMTVSYKQWQLQNNYIGNRKCLAFSHLAE